MKRSVSKMTNILRKEPIIKKSVLIMIVSMFVIFTIVTILQYKNLKGIYLEQLKIHQRLVGALVDKYPNQEVNIVKSIFKQDNRKLDLGIKILDKYG